MGLVSRCSAGLHMDREPVPEGIGNGNDKAAGSARCFFANAGDPVFDSQYEMKMKTKWIFYVDFT